MSISARHLVAGAIEIPSLPEVFLKVTEIINSTQYSAADIGRVISNDYLQERILFQESPHDAPLRRRGPHPLTVQLHCRGLFTIPIAS
jgi:hypothetical protein